MARARRFRIVASSVVATAVLVSASVASSSGSGWPAEGPRSGHAGPPGALAPAPEAAGELRFDGTAALLTRLHVDDYAPHLPAGDDASESWELLAWFPSGHTITVRLMVTNQGPGDATGLAVSTVTRPDGTTEVMKNSRDRGDWTWNADPEAGFTVRLATHELALDDPDYRLAMDYVQATFELSARRRTPAYRPGVLRYGDPDDYLDLLVMAPRLDVEGRIRFADGTEATLEGGRGTLLRTASNLQERARYVARFRLDGFAGATEVSFLEVTGPEEESYRRAGYVLLIADDEVLLASREVAHRHWQYQEGPERPRWRVPQRSELWGWGPDNPRSERPEVTVHADLRVQNQLNVVDLINSAAARFFVRMTMNPVRYQLRGEYRVEWDRLSGSPEGVAVGSLSLPTEPPREY